jgi:hypothetical protein
MDIATVDCFSFNGLEQADGKVRLEAYATLIFRTVEAISGAIYRGPAVATRQRKVA